LPSNSQLLWSCGQGRSARTDFCLGSGGWGRRGAGFACGLWGRACLRGAWMKKGMRQSVRVRNKYNG
jgi:hypothetical protein